MTYRRNRYSRYGRSRRNRYRRSGRLSTYNIASKTSAKAQARQILALRRRTNILFKRTRREIEISNPGFATIEGRGSGGIAYESTVSQLNLTASLLRYLNDPQVFTGDKAQCKSIHLNGVLQWNATVPENGVAYARVIIAQMLGDYDELPSSPMIGSGNLPVALGPLRPNTSDNMRIISQKLVKITTNNPANAFSWTFRNLGLARLNWTDNVGWRANSLDPWTNDVVMYIQILNRGATDEQIAFQYNLKGVFMDV